MMDGRNRKSCFNVNFWNFVALGYILAIPIGESTNNITNLLSCIERITRDYNDNTDFLFLDEEIELIEQNDTFLKNISGVVVRLRVDQLVAHYGFFMLFPDSARKSYKSLLTTIKYTSQNKFLITLLSCEPNSFGEIFEQFWDLKILDVVILCQASPKVIHLYTYDPFQKSFCNEPNFKLSNVWNIDGEKFNYPNSLFKKQNNFQGCPFICFAKNRPPDSIVRKTNQKWELDGVGGKLMDEIRKRFNFTAVVEVPKMDVSVDKYGYDISEGFPELVTTRLKNYSIDLAFGIYSHIIYDNPEVEFSSVAVSECYGWAVPASMGKAIPPWMYYTQEFSFIVWLIILLVYLGSVLIIFIRSHLHYQYSIFQRYDFSSIYSLSLLLGISATPRLLPGQGRIYTGSFILYSLIISSAYQSSLGSFLTVPWKAEQIETFQEIVNSNFKVDGSPQPGRILEKLAKGIPALEELSMRFRIHRDHVESLVHKIQKQKDTVTFAAQRFLQFYISNELNKTEKNEIYLLPQCVIRAHSSPFLFKKGSWLSEPINRIIRRSVEAGLTKYWFLYSTPHINTSPFSEISPLSMHRIRSAFAVLLIGSCISILTFIFEIYYHRHKN